MEDLLQLRSQPNSSRSTMTTKRRKLESRCWFQIMAKVLEKDPRRKILLISRSVLISKETRMMINRALKVRLIKWLRLLSKSQEG